MIARVLTTTCLGLTLCTMASAQVEDFEGGTNEGTWEFQDALGTTTGNMILAAGGNPDAYLDSGPVDDFADFYPRAVTTTASAVFHGDYRARNIAQISCDVKVDENTFGVSLTMTLLLKNNGGTPFNFADDCFVWKFYDNAPAEGAGWTSHVFDFDSQSLTAPAGFQLGHLGAGITNCSADVDSVWNSVITNVTDVEIWYGTPITFPIGIPQTLDVGIDNIAISEDTTFADACNGDGGDQMGCTNCPCGNNAAAGTIGGCINQSGLSAQLVPSGSVSVTAPDPTDLRFDMTGGNPMTLAVLVSGDNLAPQNMMNPCFGLGQRRARHRNSTVCAAP